jgi:hypothetical protein
LKRALGRAQGSDPNPIIFPSLYSKECRIVDKYRMRLSPINSL